MAIPCIFDSGVRKRLAGRYGLKVVHESDHDHLQPITDAVMTPLMFAEAIIGYCVATRGSITSWGRTKECNAAPHIKGHMVSHHLTWTAADVVYDVPY